MKKLILLCSSIIALLFGFSSCKTGYVPTPVNVPLFEEQGQFAISAALGYQLTLQGAVAITDEFLVLADLNGAPADSGQTSSEFYNHSIGFGYYKKQDNNWIMESVVGAGFGLTDNIHFSRIYAQQSFGTVSDHFEFSFTPRLTLVNYSNQPLDYGSTALRSANDIFIEPTFQFRGGTLPVKFNFQLGVSIPVVYESELTYIPVFLGFGLSYKLPAQSRRGN